MLSEEHRVEPNILVLWCFVRGDTDPSTFEAWLCAEREVEELLGSELYLESISTDFGSGDAVFGLRKRLNDFVSGATDRDCECVTLPHLAVVDMGDEGLVFQKFVEEKRRGEPFWWPDLPVRRSNKMRYIYICGALSALMLSACSEQPAGSTTTKIEAQAAQQKASTEPGDQNVPVGPRRSRGS